MKCRVVKCERPVSGNYFIRGDAVLESTLCVHHTSRQRNTVYFRTKEEAQLHLIKTVL